MENSVIVASTKQVSCDLRGEAAILNLKNGVYYGLDAVGARIWNFVREPRTLRDVRDLLLSEYDVEERRCTTDLLGLVRQLAAEGLIDIQHESAP